MPLHLDSTQEINRQTDMTLEKATLPVPQFDKITLAELKEKIESCIAEGQIFLNELTETPKTAEEQLAILEHVDTLENNMSESWGILSHLNAVMNNAEIRETYQSLLPGLSEYYTQLGQHTALYQTYQQVHDNAAFNELSAAQQSAIKLALRD